MSKTIVLDEGFTYGIGAFETIAVKKGYPLFLDKHLERLAQATQKLGINLRDINKDMITQHLKKIQAEKTNEGVLKIMLSPHNIVFEFRENHYTEEDYKKGFHLEISSIRRNETSPLVYLKTLAYGDNILEKRKAQRQGFDEPLFLNSRGEVCEGATSNVFFVKDNKLFTPSVTCGLLPGIIRAWIIENYEIHELPIPSEDIPLYNEAFLTNSLLGVMPVTKIGTTSFAQSLITSTIRKHYKNDILRYFSPQEN